MANKTKQNSVDTSQKRQLRGEVVSVHPNKTIQVLVQTRKTDSKYQKQFWKNKKYAVHDEKNIAVVGDVVTFEECRPISKTKRWRLVQVKQVNA